MMDPDLIPICDTCDAIERDCPTCGAEPGQCCSSPDPTDDPRDLLEPLEVIRELRARVAELERSLKIQCDHAAELEKETAAWSRESIRLSPEDQAVFAEALLNPPPMAEPLKRAFERLASLTK